MSQKDFFKVEISEVKADDYYLCNGELMTGSQIFAYLEASEPTTPALDIERVAELTVEDLTGEQKS